MIRNPGFIKALRTAVADYMYSEGCDCCRDTEKHIEDATRLAKLLGVPRFGDGRGFNFAQYRTKVKP